MKATKTHIYKVYGSTAGKFFGEVRAKDKTDAEKKAVNKFKQEIKNLIIVY